MNRVESAFYNLAGIKPESNGIKWYSVLALEVFAKLDWLLHRTHYEGELPSSDPILLVANHTSVWDIAKGYRIGQRSGRMIRTFTRASLLNPATQETELPINFLLGSDKTGTKSKDRWCLHEENLLNF